MLLGQKLLLWISATADAPKATWKCYIMAADMQVGLSCLSWKTEGESEALYTILHVSLAFVVTVMGGRGPGYVAGILAALSVDFHYISPFWHRLGSPSALAFLALTLLFITATLYLVGMLQKAAKDAMEAKRVADAAVISRENSLAMIAHDLRQPIASLMLQAEMALNASTQGLEIDAEKKLRKSVSTLKRMDQLIEDLLDSGKMESESLCLNLEPLDLTSLTYSIVSDYQNQVGQKSIQLRMKLPDSDLPPLRADKNRLIRVISNLLGNSIKFTPEGGMIEIAVEMPDPDHEQFRISNSGPRIPHEQVPNLFKRNWQEKKTAHLGNGLGLFICQGIIKAHRGSIWYEPSQIPGPSFCFRLPLS